MDHIQFSRRGGIATIELNRSDRRNALTETMLAALLVALHGDLRIVSPEARFGLPLARLGIAVPPSRWLTPAARRPGFESTAARTYGKA